MTRARNHSRRYNGLRTLQCNYHANQQLLPPIGQDAEWSNRMGYTGHTKPINHLTAYTTLNRVLPGHAAGANGWQRGQLVNWRARLDGLAGLNRRFDYNSADAAVNKKGIGVDFDRRAGLEVRYPGKTKVGAAKKGNACGDGSNQWTLWIW